MSRIRKSKLSVVLVLAAALLVLPLPWTEEDEAGAMTRCGTEFIYYSDASLTEVVGVFTWLPESCGCQFFSWGTFSPYKTVGDSYC
jgi:hypothetical protein